ncbi:MAG: hypothetical protein ABIO92_06495 [Chloroflexia bacterium]
MRAFLYLVGTVAVFLVLLAGIGYLVNMTKTDGPTVVLYDQYDNPSWFGTASHLLQDDVDKPMEAADDFIVPEGEVWTINQVEAAGLYVNGEGPATSVNITFYEDLDAQPSRTLFMEKNITYTLASAPSIVQFTPEVGATPTPIPYPDMASGSLLVNIDPVTLGPGAYWLSVQANIYLYHGGQWAWLSRIVTSNRQALWRGPITQCRGWDSAETCLGYVYAKDQVFRLHGTRAREKPLADETATALTALPTATPRAQSTETTDASNPIPETAEISPTPTTPFPIEEATIQPPVNEPTEAAIPPPDETQTVAVPHEAIGLPSPRQFPLSITTAEPMLTTEIP